MLDLEKHISELLNSNPSSLYYVACSGGVDSMVLLHLLHKSGAKVAALHVNYQLRGEDSEKDQELVERVCNEYAIPCHLKRIQLQKHLDEKAGNLQDEARKVRYSFFETFKTDENTKIVLAHHADDQVETFFLNIARGSGIMGLACMLQNNKGYLRPLLPFSKQDIISYARTNSIQWREDVSNAGTKYQRNKLRNVVLPELKNALPTLEESVLLLTRIFQETQKEIELVIEPIVKSVQLINELSFEQFDALNTFELMELLRQLEIPLSMHEEFVKLRNTGKGKRIVLPHSKFSEVIHEENSFYFKKEDSTELLPELKIEKVTQLPTEFSKDILYLDPKNIKGDLQIRYWKKGDRMRPIGLKGSKLISDILTDAKVPNHLRDKQFVVHDAEKILWCVGYAVAASSKLESEIVKVSVVYPHAGDYAMSK